MMRTARVASLVVVGIVGFAAAEIQSAKYRLLNSWDRKLPKAERKTSGVFEAIDRRYQKIGLKLSAMPMTPDGGYQIIVKRSSPRAYRSCKSARRSARRGFATSCAALQTRKQC
jgi:hypothetical protein